MINYLLRRHTPADAELITRQRGLMMQETYTYEPDKLDEMARHYRAWIERHLDAGTYLGWFYDTPEQVTIAGLGLWLIDWPPHPLDTNGVRGYISNVYTDPTHRRQGLARLLMQEALRYCEEHQIRVVTLHASKFGRSLYESLGFEATNEMRLSR